MDLTTGYPYSLIVNGIPSDFPSLERSVKTDVVIIGGGISGALVAYYLTIAGIPCVLVDKRTIGLGSTCASTSLLQYELDIPLSELSDKIGIASATLVYQLCYEAIDTIQSISAKIKFEGFKKQKSLFYAADHKDKQKLEIEYKFRRKAGFSVELLSEKEIYQRFGFYASSGILSAKAATTDAYMFTYALLQAAIRKGLKVFDRTEIVQIDYQKRSVRLFSGHDLVLTAKKVINASGYEVKDFLKKGIVDLYSTYALASEHLPSDQWGFPEKTLLWNTADPYLYMRRTNDNRILIGGRDEKFYSPAIRDKLIKNKTVALRKDFLKLFPSMDFKPEFSWTGTFGVTKDSLPYIGTYSRTPNTYYTLGFGGNGILFSVIAAEIIRNSILGKPNKIGSLFSFDR